MGLLRYVEGSWALDQYRERFLRHDLDCLVDLHKQALMNQCRPHFATVRVFSTDPDFREFNIAQISSALAAQYPTNDCMFDLRYLTVRNGEVVDAHLIPWQYLQDGTVPGVTDPDQFRVDIPSDIDPMHLEPGAG